MDFGAISKIFLLLSFIGGFVLFAHPKLRASEILSHAFGPVPRPGELRSEYLFRVSLYSAAWLIVLLGVSSLTYILVTEYGVTFEKEETNLFVLLAIACSVAMAFLGMIGSFVWSALIQMFNRDGMYLADGGDSSDDN